MISFKQYLSEAGFSALGYQAFGLISPEGEIVEGDDSTNQSGDIKFSHEKVARELGYSGLEQAKKEGCVRWILDNTGFLSVDVYSQKNRPEVYLNNLKSVKLLIVQYKNLIKTTYFRILMKQGFFKGFSGTGIAHSLSEIDKLIDQFHSGFEYRV